jgi:restriction endonuclease S subunit
VGLEHLNPDSLKLSRWGTPSDVIGDKLRFQTGDIIFGRRRAYQRKLAVAEFDGICSAHAMVVRANTETVDPDFLPFLMQSDLFMQRAIDISVGSLSPTINWTTLRIQEFPLPPKEEQRSIAEILWAADEAIESVVRAVSDASTAKSLLVRELTQNGINHSEYRDSVLGRIPQSWSVLPLGHVCEFLDGMRVPIKESDRSKRKGKYPYYGASGIIDWIDGYIFDEDVILIGEDGANIVDRSSPMAFKVTGKCWVNNHAHVLRPQSGYDIDYLVEYLESISYLPFKSGTAQPKLNKGACESIPIPIPPEGEQSRIAGIFCLANAVLAKCSSHLLKSQEMRAGLVNRLCSARVT